MVRVGTKETDDPMRASETDFIRIGAQSTSVPALPGLLTCCPSAREWPEGLDLSPPDQERRGVVGVVDTGREA